MKKSIIAVLLIACMMLSLLSACGSQTGETTANGTPAASNDGAANTGSNDAGSESVNAALETGMVTTGSEGKTRASTNGKAENSLTVALNATTSTLDPHHYAMQVEDTVLSQIYEPLFFIDDNMEVKPMIASEVEIADDGTYVICTLREGVAFASGDPVTVDDVVYSLSRCENSMLASYFYAYSTIEVVNESTVKFSFPYAEIGAGFWDLYPYFRSVLIVNQSYCETITDDVNGDLGYNCDGTGAYMFESIDNVGNIVLTRNPGYWGEASIDTIKFVINTGDLAIAFEAGDIDYFNSTSSVYESFKGYANVGLDAQLINNVGFLGMNCSEASAFNDINVRKAAVLCLNRDDIALVASDGGGTTAYNMATPLSSYYADCTNHYDMDVAAANDLLTAAGYSANNKVSVVLIALGAYPDWVAACEIIKENLEQSYFSVTIEELADQTRYFTLDFDMFIISIGLPGSISSYATLFANSPLAAEDAGLNLSGISGEEQAAVLASMEDLSTPEKHEAAQNAVVDSFAYVPVWYQTIFNIFDGDLNAARLYTTSSVQLFSEFSWK